MVGQVQILSQELTGLTLFNNDLNNGTTNRTIVAMIEKEQKEKPLKHVPINLKLIQEKTVIDNQELYMSFYEIGSSRKFSQISSSLIETSTLALMLQKPSSACWLLLMIMLHVVLHW